MKDADHQYFMSLALEQATAALAKMEFPVGCVFVYGQKVVASGRRMNSSDFCNEIDHAEIVALRSLIAQRKDFDFSKITVYSTMEPCLMCYSTLLVNGIRRIVYSYEDAMGGGTNLPLTELSPLYRDLKVRVVGSILRDESLALFKRFFSAPGNAYLQGTYLQEYTLKQ